MNGYPSPGKVFENRKKRYVITRESIEQFGKVTRDEQWIHKSNDNDDFGGASSSSSPSVLGGVKLPIAHGFFTVSLLTFLSSAAERARFMQVRNQLSRDEKRKIRETGRGELSFRMSNESQERFVEAREGDVGDDVRVRDVQRRRTKRRRGDRVRKWEWIVRQVLA